MAIDWGMAKIAPTQGIDTNAILEAMQNRETIDQTKKRDLFDQTMARERHALSLEQEERLKEQQTWSNLRSKGLDKAAADQLVIENERQKRLDAREGTRFARETELYDTEKTQAALYDQVMQKADYDPFKDLLDQPMDEELAHKIFGAMDVSPDTYEKQLIQANLPADAPPGTYSYLADKIDFNPLYDIERNRAMGVLRKFLTPEKIREMGADDVLANRFLGHIGGGEFNEYAGLQAERGDPERIDSAMVEGNLRDIDAVGGNYNRALAEQLKIIMQGDTGVFDTIDNVRYDSIGDGVYQITEEDTFNWNEAGYMKKEGGKWVYSPDQSPGSWISVKKNLDDIRSKFE